MENKNTTGEALLSESLLFPVHKEAGATSAKSTYYCLVVNNPYNAKTGGRTAEDLYKNCKAEDTSNSFEAPDIPTDQPVIPEAYLGKKTDSSMETESLLRFTSSLGASFSSSKEGKKESGVDIEDFCSFCRNQKYDEVQMFLELLKRLKKAGFVVYPREMFADDGVTVNQPGMWTSPDEDDVYLLLHVDQCVLEMFAEQKQVNLQTNPFSYMGGAGTVYSKHNERSLSKSVLAFKEEFEKARGNSPPSNDTESFKPWGFRFYLPQRARLVDRILKDKYHGCGIEFDEMRRQGIAVKHFFAIHNGIYMQEYALYAWASIRPLFSLSPLKQPIEGVVKYFGEKVAIYFHWIRAYTMFLAVPGLIGLPFSIYLWISKQHNSSEGVYAVFVVIWAVLWITHWRREEKLFALEYGTDIEIEQELVRDEFDGARAELSDYDLLHTRFVHPLTMEVSVGGKLVHRKDEPWKRTLKRWFVTYPVVLLAISTLLTILYFLTRYRFSGSDEATVIANYATIGVMVVFSNVFGMVVDMLTDYENNRTDTEHENSLILKSFAFSFCNAYSALFIIALWPIGINVRPMSQSINKYCHGFQNFTTSGQANEALAFTWGNTTSPKCICAWNTYWMHNAANISFSIDDITPVLGSKCNDYVMQWNNNDRLDQLFAQLFTILVIMPMVQNFQELFLAKAMTHFRVAVDTHGGSVSELVKKMAAIHGGCLGLLTWLLSCGCFRKSTPAQDAAGMQIKNDDGVNVSVDEVIAATSGKRFDRSDPTQTNVEKRIILWRESQRDPYRSTCGDYHEIVVQFGYMCMFCLVFPIGPFVCMLFNCLEIRIDAIKLVTSCQRSRAQVANSIGAWNSVFTFLVMASVVTNSYAICFITGYVADWRGDSDFTTRMSSFIVVQYFFFFVVAAIFALRGPIPELLHKTRVKQSILKDRRINHTEKSNANEKRMDEMKKDI